MGVTTMTAELIEQELAALKPHLQQRFKVRRLGYFGSFAVGDQQSDSDIDIIVEFAETPGWEFFDLQQLLEDTLKRKVDLVSLGALKAQMRDSILNQVRYI